MRFVRDIASDHNNICFLLTRDIHDLSSDPDLAILVVTGTSMWIAEPELWGPGKKKPAGDEQ